MNVTLDMADQALNQSVIERLHWSGVHLHARINVESTITIHCKGIDICEQIARKPYKSSINPDTTGTYVCLANMR